MTQFQHFYNLCVLLLWNDVGPGTDAKTCARAAKYNTLNAAMRTVLDDPVLGEAMRRKFNETFVCRDEIKREIGRMIDEL